MKLAAITTELRKLAALPRGTISRVNLGGATYTILGGATKAKFNPPKKETPNRIMNAHDQAIALYKTEHIALAAIRRQIDQLGKDIDPNVKKRAEKLAQTIAEGHLIWTRSQTSRRWDCKAKHWIEENTVSNYVKGNTAERMARYLGRSLQGRAWEPELTLTDEELTELQKTFIIHII